MQAATTVPNGEVRGKHRQRGPVEEVIAKRMRQLVKKLQRYRVYKAQDPSTLNADQRAALIALPALEGAFKELEDLIRDKGPVEEQELIQAAKLREATAAAQAEAATTSSSKQDAFKDALATRLSLFLRLHTLLHPARAGDHQNLTFEQLTLPLRLRDEVQATDVLRVARMWDELTAGGDSAKGALDGLLAGATGEDDELDHLHHLLYLLSQPEIEMQPDDDTVKPARVVDDVETAFIASTAEEPAVEVVPSTSTQTSRMPSETGHDSETGLANGHGQDVQQSGSGFINFLQDDELEIANTDKVDDSFEVVPMLEAHQTSGFQPPGADKQDAPIPDTAPAIPIAAPSAFAPAPSQDWADLDVEEPTPVDQPVSIPDPQAEEEIIDAADIQERPEPAVAVIQENELSVEPALSDSVIETPTAVESSSSAPSSASGSTLPSASPSARPSQLQQNQRNPAPFRQTMPRESVPKTMVDDDGFEMSVRRGAQMSRGGGSHGREDFRGNGRGMSGRGGRGGRGGYVKSPAMGVGSEARAKTGPQSQEISRPRASGAANKGRQGGQGQTEKPKQSIFKSIQPGEPKSAPALG